jgi:PleD family two-component response regulator
MFSQLALENILFEELKLKSKVTFYNNGSTIAKTI